MPSYHFDVGDSNEGPIGFCARIRASSKEEALKKLKFELEALDLSAEVLTDDGDDPGVEYLTVYFNTDKLTVEDIDDED